jgi:hypothetical protein
LAAARPAKTNQENRAIPIRHYACRVLWASVPSSTEPFYRQQAIQAADVELFVRLVLSPQNINRAM